MLFNFVAIIVLALIHNCRPFLRLLSAERELHLINVELIGMNEPLIALLVPLFFDILTLNMNCQVL